MSLLPVLPFLALPSAPATDPFQAGSAPWSHEIGPHASASIELNLTDAVRGRTLETLIRHPEPGPGGALPPCPVVLFSHGEGGSRRAFAELTAAWAARGFVVISVTHSDSLELRQRAGERLDAQSLQRLGKDVDQLDRRADFLAVLTALEVLETAIELSRGDQLVRLDRERIAVAGFSAGAVTAGILAGAEVRGARLGAAEPRSFGDPRIDAAILISAHGLADPIHTEKSWSPLSLPLLVVAGSEDIDLHSSETPQSRRDPFRLAPAGDKHLLWIEGATHGSYQVSPREPEPGEERRNDDPQAALATLAATTAFLGAYLADDPAARAWLAAGSFAELSGSRARLETR